MAELNPDHINHAFPEETRPMMYKMMKWWGGKPHNIFASSVDLKALTCGLRDFPGLLDAIVEIFASSIFKSAIRAGVLISPVLISLKSHSLN